ncbi:MAG: hypothetical protein HYR60_07365 [Acidobacteria bacterium]|nr:hypothetical protein [Acidobacteriota bacterium]
MIVVREVFVAKPGQASKLAGLMKEVAESGAVGHCRVMTDLTGDFNRVVLETEAESLAEFESRMQDYGKNQALREKMKGYTDLYLTGGREIYRVW